MDLQAIADAIERVPLSNGRRVIAIAGPPASGKSTLADALEQAIQGSCVLPMDGFHRSNDDLRRHGLLARKGAPETFDVAGFVRVVEAVRLQKDVSFPTFDRGSDAVVPDSGRITAQHHTVLVEGNYLLLDHAPWNALLGFWDFSIKLEVPNAELERRLVARWLAHGHDEAGALQRAQSNDLPNARFMQRHSVAADMTLQQA